MHFAKLAEGEPDALSSVFYCQLSPLALEGGESSSYLSLRGGAFPPWQSQKLIGDTDIFLGKKELSLVVRTQTYLILF